MAKNYIDNLSEETRKGMLEKAEQGIWPSFAPLGYTNIMGAHGKRVIAIDPETGPLVARLFEWFEAGNILSRSSPAKLVSLVCVTAGQANRSGRAPFIGYCGAGFTQDPSSGLASCMRGRTHL